MSLIDQIAKNNIKKYIEKPSYNKLKKIDEFKSIHDRISAPFVKIKNSNPVL